MSTIMVSGGFDPVHIGHLRLIEAAAQIAPLTVILNSDDWLIRKKGFFLMPWQERAEILLGFSAVSRVVPVVDTDGTVCQALQECRPTHFGNGGDRLSDNVPEVEVCRRLGIKLVFGLGGTKAAASSLLVRRSKVARPWGHYEVLADGPFYRVKRLIIEPGAEMSNQKHELRSEYIFTKAGLEHTIPAGQWHRLWNPMAKTPMEMIEVQIGNCQESDIEREREYE